MAVPPVVRYMILCENWSVDVQNPRRINIEGLVTQIQSRQSPHYPLLYRELNVLLILTEGFGAGMGRISCVFEETGEVIFATGERRIEFRGGPLAVAAVGFRLQNVWFPTAGIYSFQFSFDSTLIEERPVRLG